MVQDITRRLGNDTTTPSRNEEDVHSDEITNRAETLVENSTQRDQTARESVHPMEKVSDTATYHIIPLFKPEQSEVNLFCVHPAGRYAMNLTPISNGFTQQVSLG